MTNIERYQQLESQKYWVQKELSKGEYKAAGLNVYVSIGDASTEEETGKNFSFGVYSGIEKELLELILKGLEETLRIYKKNIEEEHKKLTEFLNTFDE